MPVSPNSNVTFYCDFLISVERGVYKVYALHATVIANRYNMLEYMVRDLLLKIRQLTKRYIKELYHQVLTQGNCHLTNRDEQCGVLKINITAVVS